MTVLTTACRWTGCEGCAGHIYLGSIFGKPTNCQCRCHPPIEKIELAPTAQTGPTP